MRAQQWSLNLLILITLILHVACNMQAGRNQYILAERLFNDQKYAAAVDEFKKIINNDPRGKLSQQAYFRIGTIQSLYLNQYREAIQSFYNFIETSENKSLVYEADKNIAEIYFLKLEDYSRSNDIYKKLIERYPSSQEQDLFLLRLAKGYYGTHQFEKAVEGYEQILKKYPRSQYILEAMYQIGNTYFTIGNCRSAMEFFEKVKSSSPGSTQAVFAQFGIGNCYEELEKPETALEIYSALVEKYPSKQVIQGKIQRLKERLKRQY